jgi:hypothetical protein
MKRAGSHFLYERARGSVVDELDSERTEKGAREETQVWVRQRGKAA